MAGVSWGSSFAFSAISDHCCESVSQRRPAGMSPLRAYVSAFARYNSTLEFILTCRTRFVALEQNIGAADVSSRRPKSMGSHALDAKLATVEPAGVGLG
jgi:hypothetical protein